MKVTLNSFLRMHTFWQISAFDTGFVFFMLRRRRQEAHSLLDLLCFQESVEEILGSDPEVLSDAGSNRTVFQRYFPHSAGTP